MRTWGFTPGWYENALSALYTDLNAVRF